jgi:hypothetical protein
MTRKVARLTATAMAHDNKMKNIAGKVYEYDSSDSPVSM